MLLAELTILKHIAYIVIVLSIVIAIFIIGTKFVLGTTNPVYVVSSGSMIPTLNVGDLVIIQHSNNNSSSSSSSFNNLKVGDIIVFKSYGVTRTGQHLTIVHRVAAIRMDIHSNRIIRTKGDANPISIPLVDYPIIEKNYIGKVVYVIPKLGIIPLTSDRTLIYVIIGSIIIIIILAYNFRKRRRENKREPML
ncbi:MAG: signal peptidase I [Nitrososphaeraceae archaeon]|nr:signal peptidase I [Nitrososphaeraceae archaeon]